MSIQIPEFLIEVAKRRLQNSRHAAESHKTDLERAEKELNEVRDRIARDQRDIAELTLFLQAHGAAD